MPQASLTAAARTTILLGLTFSDGQLLPQCPVGADAPLVFGPAGLTRYLETFYALGGPTVNRTALRTEQYRQLIRAHLAAQDSPPFYAASFAADTFATAEELLARRDELVAAGYQIWHPPAADCPARLRVVHELEALVVADNDLPLLPGAADNLHLLLSALPERRHPPLRILVNEPRPLLPPGLRRLLERLEAQGEVIVRLPEPEPLAEASDLGRWQAALRRGTPGGTLQGDGSLLLLRAKRETHLAAYIARTLKNTPAYRPGVLLSVRNQTLDNAFAAEGLPTMGVLSASLARPSLQVLKLITAFLWKPYEVARIMEFVSLVAKPLHWLLGQRIATYLADTPGFFGPRWYGMVEGFFRELAEDPAYSDSRIKEIRRQYEHWFGRRRYGRQERVPEFELRQLFNELREWALEERVERRKQDARQQRPAGDHASLLVLAAQAQRALELLDAQPETDFGLLDIERLVRTVYEPAPTPFRPEEQGAPPTILAPASALHLPGQPPLQDLIWWDFIDCSTDYFFHRYYPHERTWLAQHEVQLNGPDTANALALWQAQRPVLQTRRQLVLCLPEAVDGSLVEAHPLLGDLEASFPEGALARITLDIDATALPAVADATGWQLPTFSAVPLRPLAPPVPQLRIERLRTAPPRAQESPTALEDLLYYPHKWVFRHQLAFRGTPLLQIASENRLRGNLSHLFIEQLLNEIRQGKVAPEKTAVQTWIHTNAARLLQREGAVLLEYGQEPERIQFIRTMAYSAWSLVHYIEENGWQIRGSEEILRGELTPMGGQEVQGRADLVLERIRDGQREVAIVDLKWRGKTAFRNLLRNAKDVQLCLYAHFAQHPLVREDTPASPSPARIHTAYYVLRDALMLARDEAAFTRIETVSSPEEAARVQQTTLAKIRATFDWRWEQFAEGIVEIRCAETIGALEDLYLDEPHEARLEMEDGDARFDDYQRLIGLVR